MSKKILVICLVVFILSLVFSACTTEADVASRNISKSADMFNVNRRIIFYNGITNEYILTIYGYCALGNYDDPGELTVTCKVSNDGYKKHFLGLSNNVTYIAEQLDPQPVNVYNYKVILKPSTIIPDIDIK